MHHNLTTDKNENIYLGKLLKIIINILIITCVPSQGGDRSPLTENLKGALHKTTGKCTSIICFVCVHRRTLFSLYELMTTYRL